MKFSVQREHFLNQLGIAVRGVSTRSAIQTLAGVLIRTDSGQVELQATDMELGIRVQVEAGAEREGAVVLPGRLLLDVVRSLPKSPTPNTPICLLVAVLDIAAAPPNELPPDHKVKSQRGLLPIHLTLGL